MSSKPAVIRRAPASWGVRYSRSIVHSPRWNEALAEPSGGRCGNRCRPKRARRSIGASGRPLPKSVMLVSKPPIGGSNPLACSGSPRRWCSVRLMSCRLSPSSWRATEIEADLKAFGPSGRCRGHGFDLAVRIEGTAGLVAKARRLGELRTVVYGAPSYFACYGRPKHPDDLASHECIVRSTGDGRQKRGGFGLAVASATVLAVKRFLCAMAVCLAGWR